LRDVGKALGLPEDVIKLPVLAGLGLERRRRRGEHAEELNLNLGDRRLRLALELARQLIGTPRHLSQHPGGFVLTQRPARRAGADRAGGMEDRQVIEWDKDDIDA
jgi:error-prone DNA polymerase